MQFPNRGMLTLSGADHRSFLQGLITNDLTGLADGQALYSCLLTAQGRFLHDFFVIAEGGRLLLDCEADRREDLLQRLKRFRLRSQVEIADETETYRVFYHPRESATPVPNGLIFHDPRSDALGHRILERASPRSGGNDEEFENYDRLRISLGVPDGSRDMVPEQALLLENNIDLLNGISWTKGCYVGQELTARMHYKGGVRRRLVAVRLQGPPVTPGTPIVEDGQEMGEMRSSNGDIGLALLRVEAGEGGLRSGETILSKFP